MLDAIAKGSIPCSMMFWIFFSFLLLYFFGCPELERLNQGFDIYI